MAWNGRVLNYTGMVSITVVWIYVPFFHLLALVFASFLKVVGQVSLCWLLPAVELRVGRQISYHAVWEKMEREAYAALGCWIRVDRWYIVLKHVRYIVWLICEFSEDISHPSGCVGELGKCNVVREYVRIVFIINQQIDCSVAYYLACNIQVMRWIKGS